ncbi:MAG: alkaline phosphatase family protein [Anaerolineae bacterium]|nr:alkaline phosphatase family protein [Anaerolineae bacterium]
MPSSLEIETFLRTEKPHHLFEPAQESEFVWPEYKAHSIVNIAATIAKIFGKELPSVAPPLAPVYWRGFESSTRRIILVLLDALGYLQFLQALEEDPSCLWHNYIPKGRLFPMTSVCPSTTATALASLTTGTEPIVHGLLGYQLWLREYGVLTEMLALKPVYGTGKETLLDWGLLPERFLPVPSIGTLLKRVGIHTTALIPARHLRGGLTRICYRGFQRVFGYNNENGLWSLTQYAITQEENPLNFYFLYWGGIDSTIHSRGTEHGFWQAQLRLITEACQRQFLEKLDPSQREGTLFILCADHGFIASPIEAAYDTEGNSPLARLLLIPYSGESRTAYLHGSLKHSKEFLKAVQECLEPHFIIKPTSELLRAGLWGFRKAMPEARSRLGDLVALARGKHYLDRQNLRFVLRGRHGGLAPEEMLVPWLIFRLDG